MGEKAQEISKVNRDDLLKILNIAFAEEWLAYYQYWMGAQVAVGPQRKRIAKEFMEHAKEEHDHAQKLSDRIIQLGGTPVLNPNEWERLARCKYDEPSDPYIMTLLKQNLEAERCAISRYQGICDMCFGKDYETFGVAREILSEELDHEQDLEDYIADIDAAEKHFDANEQR